MAKTKRAVRRKAAKKKLTANKTKKPTRKRRRKKHFEVNRTFHFNGDGVRYDRMEGRDYIVVPMVMITEGIHNGSNGPLFYPEDEFTRNPGTWNHIPVVVYHPSINGVGVSACDPDILTVHKVGVVMNTKWDSSAKKLRAEAWIEENRANDVDERIMERINNREMMEVSTGLFSEHYKVDGEHNGEEYEVVARNFHADHLALLPDQIGACSIADGGGLLQTNADGGITWKNDKIREAALAYANHIVTNALSHDNIRQALWGALRSLFGEDVHTWIEDVYENFFVYSALDKLYRLNYTASDTQVTVTGEPEEVVRVTEYRTLNGAFVGNNQPEENEMSKKKTVDELIANKGTQWAETDRAFLMNQDSDTLAKFAPVANSEGGEEVDGEEGDTTQDPAQPAQPPATAPAVPAEPATNAITMENLPQEIREVYAFGAQAIQQQRATANARILAAPGNVFTEAQLNAMDLNQLNQTASLVSNAQAPATALPSTTPPPVGQQPATFNFGGAATPPPTPPAELAGNAEPLGTVEMFPTRTATAATE